METPVDLKLKLNESIVEIRFLKEQVDSLKEQLKQQEVRSKRQDDSFRKKLKQQEDRSKEQLKQQEDRSKEQLDSLKEQLKEQRKQMKGQTALSKEQIDRLNEQIFKLANRTTNTTNIMQRNNYLISSLSPLDLEPNRIQKVIDEMYTPERFRQGIAGAIQTINDIITDPDTGKLMHICTDYSRKKFVYIDEDEKKELKSDIGARLLIKSIKKPLSTAITKQYLDLINSSILDQDKRDDMFGLHVKLLDILKEDTLSCELAKENVY